MKFTLPALLGAAAAGSNFLQETILELDAQATPTDWSTKPEWKKYAITNKVGELICQPHEGYIFWDLKPMDAHKSVDYIGVNQEAFGGSTFAVELCEPAFETKTMPAYKNSDKESMTVGTGAGNLRKGNAYWTEADGSSSNFTPKYSFLNGNFVSVENDDEEYTGWTLTYASQENCGTSAAPQPFVFTINGVCDEKNVAGTYSHYAKDGDCAASVSYTGKAGCVAFNGNQVWDTIKPYTGFILIIMGAAMTFAGCKFLYQFVSTFIGIIITMVFYLVISNLFFGVKTTVGPKVGLIVVALALGSAGVYFSYKFSRRFAIPIIAAGAGAFGFKLLSNVAGIRNEYAAIGILVLGAVAGAFLGYKLNHLVRTVGTAFLGAYILTRGAGFFFGGFPEGASDVKIHEIKGHDKIVWYFVGFVVAFIAGSVVQIKFVDNEDLQNEHKENDDVFNGEDEDKKCGCF